MSRDEPNTVEVVLKRFEADWQSDRQPNIDEFLSAHAAQRAILLLELVHTDLEYHLKANEPARVEDYLARYPELASEREAVLGLIAAEFGLRRRTESNLAVAQYIERFPHLAAELRSRLSTRTGEDRQIVVPRGASGRTDGAVETARIHEIEDGTRIGPYRLLRRIGRGSFGEVWLGERRGALATTTVAVKIPTAFPSAVDRVREEAKTWVRASGHPNIVPIIDADIYDGRITVVSEYVDGGSLEQLLESRKGRSLSLHEAVDIAMGTLCALEHLHARGIIHRDLKPANVLLQQGIPRLTDFGLSRLVADTEISRVMAGTPSYMAPEALDGERNVRTDLWSLGVVFYRLLTGQLPFPQKGIRELVVALSAKGDVPMPVEAPRELQSILGRALAKRPEQRFESAAQMRAALGKFRRGLDVEAEGTRKGELATHLPYRTVAVTGSMNSDETRVRNRVSSLLRPYHGRFTTWYAGTYGTVDEAVVAQLTSDEQRVLLVGYHSSDISARMALLAETFDLPFVDAQHEHVPAVPGAPSQRDIYFATKADLVILLWDGQSTGTRRLIQWLVREGQDHLVAFL